MIDCDKASTLASAALDRKLTVAEFIGVWAHRLVCGPCRAYRRQLVAMRRRARRLGDEPSSPTPMDAEAKDRIRAQLRKRTPSSPGD